MLKRYPKVISEETATIMLDLVIYCNAALRYNFDKEKQIENMDKDDELIYSILSNFCKTMGIEKIIVDIEEN